MKYNYRIFSPCGNNTALVFGLEYLPQRKEINDAIMLRHSDVEQVGFLSGDKNNPRLEMAGGEFCGNAARSAAFWYLDGKRGDLDICVSGISRKLKAGVCGDGEAYAEMPVKEISKENAAVRTKGIFHIPLYGIEFLIVDKNKTKESFAEIPFDETNIKRLGLDLIKEYGLLTNLASGVIFLDGGGSKIRINPCVWVKAVKTLFYETACGSGSVATAIQQALFVGLEDNFAIEQPSGKIIHCGLKMKDGKVKYAQISGEVLTDKQVYEGNI